MYHLKYIKTVLNTILLHRSRFVNGEEVYPRISS